MPPFDHNVAWVKKIRWSAWGLSLCGALGACLLSEAGLRRISSGLQNQWVALTDPIDSLPVKEFRQYYEGIATSHFRWDRERVLVPSAVPGAVQVVLLGDSFTEALQVGDAEVFGAIAQTALAGPGTSFALHEFGWSGADIPQYVAIAGAVDARFHPDVVVSVVSQGDFGTDLMTGSLMLAEDSLGRVEARGVPQARTTAPRSLPGRVGQWAGAQSVLVYRLVRSLAEGLSGGAAPAVEDGVGRDTLVNRRVQMGLQALKDAYGPRALILFIADVGLDGNAPPSALERALAAEARAAGVEVVSTREAMEIDVRTHHRASRGFLNTPPGSGHINAVGHRITGEVLAAALRARSSARSGPRINFEVHHASSGRPYRGTGRP